MKNKTSGFTLAEIVVGMAAAAILMLASGSVLVSGNKTYHHYAMSVRAGAVGDAVGDLVSGRLQYASDVLIEEENEENKDSYSIGFTKDGNFLVDGREVYGNLPEAGLRCGCRFTSLPEDTPVIRMDIYVEDQSGGILYRGRETVMLFNMELSGETVDCRIVERDGAIDSADQDVVFFYLENGRRYGQDE